MLLDAADSLLPEHYALGRVPGVSLPKANPASPHQRRRHVAHGPRRSRLHAGAAEAPETSGQWQRAAELLLAQADVTDLSRQVELALFYDAKLDVSKAPAK